MTQTGQHAPAVSAYELHCHSTASDGTYPPAQVVAMAAARGVRVLSLTDHDTTDGIPAAAAAAVAHGLTLIPGVELTCSVESGEVHLLGYFVRAGDAQFQETLAEFRGGREDRGRRIVTQLQSIGIPIDWERVKEIAGTAGVGRPHVARALVELGTVQDVTEAFDTYLGRGKPGYVERMKLDPGEAVRFVRAAGGVPVLAHPYSVDDLHTTLDAMVAAGLLGLEAYYQDYSPDEREALAALAARYRLLATVGSDFHGDVHGGALLGGTPAPDDTLERLIVAAYTVQ
jgi:predicted metal-dependent phosphoesterase TrpH